MFLISSNFNVNLNFKIKCNSKLVAIDSEYSIKSIFYYYALNFILKMHPAYRTVEAPSSRIVIIEGIYALSEKLRPLMDLRVSVTGGVHLDLVKRVIRDIQRAGQEPEEIIHQISETVHTFIIPLVFLYRFGKYVFPEVLKFKHFQVYPMYKAFIEPDLQTAHIKIINKFNPFTGFQSPTYILKVITHYFKSTCINERRKNG